jgi:hypothetical protein
MTCALDPELNKVIRTIAGRILPNGFCTSTDAPSTFEQLCAHIQSGKPFTVHSGASARTVYGDPAVNYAFRAWHDWCHWIAAHPFTDEGEAAVCAMHCRHLIADYGCNAQTDSWCRIIKAEVIGQARFQKVHKRFPDDQIGFVTAYLQNPEAALRWSLW